jgi:hypothetical protein
MAGCCTGLIAVASSMVPAVHVKISSRFYVPSYMCVCVLLFPHVRLQIPYQSFVIFKLAGWIPYQYIMLLLMLLCTLSHTGMTLHIFTYFTLILFF